MRRLQADRLLDLAILLGESSWVGIALGAVIAPALVDPGRFLPVVLGMLLGGYAVAAFGERISSIAGDRWVVTGVGLAAALVTPLFLEPTGTILSPLGLGMWLVGAVAWGRGVMVANERQSFNSASVSFVIGFVVIAIAVLVRGGSDADVLALPVVFVLAYMAAFALATLDRASDLAGGRMGTEWLGWTLAALAGVAGVAVVFFNTLGPLLREPALTVLTWVVRALIAVVIGIVGTVIFFLTLIFRDVQFPEPRRFLIEGESEPVEADQLTIEQLVSFLPGWLIVVLQLLAVAAVVALVGLAIYYLYRRRLVTREFGAQGERSSVFSGDDLRNDLLGLFRRQPSAPRKTVVDPLQALGADGRWLRGRFDELSALTSVPESATVGVIRRAVRSNPELRPLEPTSDAFEEARYGGRLPAPARLAELRRLWQQRERDRR